MKKMGLDQEIFSKLLSEVAPFV